MKRVDRDAMKRAIEEQRQQGGESRWQIEAMLAKDPWQDVGAFAAYACQCRNLRLEPWQGPPSEICTDRDVKEALATPRDDCHGWREAAEIVLRLRAVGLSYLEPSPMAALAAAEAAEARAEVEAARARRAIKIPNENIDPATTKEGDSDAKRADRDTAAP